MMSGLVVNRRVSAPADSFAMLDVNNMTDEDILGMLTRRRKSGFEHLIGRKTAVRKFRGVLTRYTCHLALSTRSFQHVLSYVLFCFVLFCFVLFCFVLSCLVLSCLVFSRLVLSRLILSRLVLSCHVVSCRVVSCRVLFCLVLSCLVLSCLVLSCHVVSCRILSCLVLSCFFLSCLVVSCLVLSCLVLCRIRLDSKSSTFVAGLSSPLSGVFRRSQVTASYLSSRQERMVQAFKENEERAAFLVDLEVWYKETKAKVKSNPVVHFCRRSTRAILRKILPEEIDTTGMFMLDEYSKPLPKGVVETEDMVALVRFCGENGLLQHDLHVAYNFYSYIIDEFEVPEIVAVKPEESSTYKKKKDHTGDGDSDSDSDGEDDGSSKRNKKTKDKKEGIYDNGGVVILKKTKISKDGVKGFESICRSIHPSCAYTCTHLLFKSRRDAPSAQPTNGKSPTGKSPGKDSRKTSKMMAPPPPLGKAKGVELKYFEFLERLHYFCRLPLVDMYTHTFAMVWRELNVPKESDLAASRTASRTASRSIHRTASANTSPAKHTGSFCINASRFKKYPLLAGSNVLNETKTVGDPREFNAWVTRSLVKSIFLYTYNNVIPPQVQLLLDMMPWSEDETVAVSTLVRFCMVFPILLFPMVLLQRAVQKKFFGYRFWEGRMVEGDIISTYKMVSHLDPQALKPPKNEKAAWFITCSNLLVELYYQSICPPSHTTAHVASAAGPFCTRLPATSPEDFTNLAVAEAVANCQEEVNYMFASKHSLPAMLGTDRMTAKLFDRNSAEFKTLTTLCRSKYGYKMTQFFLKSTLDAWEEGIIMADPPKECLTRKMPKRGEHMDRATALTKAAPPACTCGSCLRLIEIDAHKVKRACPFVGGCRVRLVDGRYDVEEGTRNEAWSVHTDDFYKHPFYYNFQTGERQWDAPAVLGGYTEKFVWNKNTPEDAEEFTRRKSSFGKSTRRQSLFGNKTKKTSQD
jgi:hypothetical protein